MIESDPQRLLGAFIRAHREGLTPPKAVGRRRTPGLRREELAEAAGVSVTWITWLEQGRDVTASTSTLTRLAEALTLT
ncbi:MAG: helix-turn-helix transcriptional regulator, partial [Methylobacter sp.]|nr:helix-turn-helix transcriptional regulator [Methylobacter sp.]